MDIFLSGFAEVPDPGADNARHDLYVLFVVRFAAVLCGAANCAVRAAKGSCWNIGFIISGWPIPALGTPMSC